MTTKRPVTSNKDLPSGRSLFSIDRPGKITYDPEGWHNYNLKYEDENGDVKKAWLMNRGYLIGYMFSGLNSEDENLVPMTHYLNAGTIDDKATNVENPFGMLFYETQLNNWLKKHKDYMLDYYVVANYNDDELVPRSISLFWSGFDEDGEQIVVKVNAAGKATYDGLTGSVTLNNVSKNAKINYKRGTAKSIY